MVWPCSVTPTCMCLTCLTIHFSISVFVNSTWLYHAVMRAGDRLLQPWGWSRRISGARMLVSISHRAWCSCNRHT